MTITAFPLNDSPIADAATWARIARHWTEDGVIAGELGALEVTAGTGMSVDVAPGRALIRGVLLNSDATETLAIQAADTTYDRIDVVVARVDFINGKNYSGLYVLTGTPAATPSAPSVTQSDGVVWELPLAEVHVPAGATSLAASNLTDRRVYARPVPHGNAHGKDGDDPVTIAPLQINPQGAGSGLDADTWQGITPAEIEQIIAGTGYCTRFLNGTQMCWAYVTVPAGGTYTWTFPAAFAAQPSVAATTTGGAYASFTALSATSVGVLTNDANNDRGTNVSAIGKWK